MSMYNLIHGQNPMSDLLLAALGLTQASIYRFRDSYITGDREIAIYTRGGGGNRECYGCLDIYEPKDAPDGAEVSWTYEREGEPTATYRARVVRGPDGQRHSSNCTRILQSQLRAHDAYLRDEDDDFDCTYSTFYFRMSPALAEALAVIPAADATPEQRWRGFLDKLSTTGPDAADPQIERVKQALEPLLREITTAVR